MSRLPMVLAFPRVLRHLRSVGASLPPVTRLSLDRPDPVLRPVLSAAWEGDHAPARELLADTRRRRAWERRDECVDKLAEVALVRPRWLEVWLEKDGDDPDAALVSAGLQICRAWEARTAARAKHVSRDRFAEFFRILGQATPVIDKATELNPGDPVPWRVALQHARGTQAPRPVFDRLLLNVMDCDPDHYGCHANALQFLCAKWYGSHEEMFDFAETAAARARPGRLLAALPVEAVTEYLTEHPAGRGPVPRQRVTAAVDRTLEVSAGYEPGDPAATRIRNHLALALARCGRWEEALRQFELIGTDVREIPWAYLDGENEVRGFADARENTRVQVAKAVPFFSRYRPAA
ncbi:hypothetical protein [Streptomyces sp. B5E4]|uniref:hypothetical protein n=1 Tax=Streptomyces sp. B5E4 TaxID=3153568 RepID=UPI00325CA67E